MPSRKLISVLLLIQSQIVSAWDGPGSAVISAVNSHGTGCPSGTVSVSLTPDQKTMTMLFDRYVSEIDGVHSIVDKKFCMVDVNLQIPSGWSFSLFSSDYRGFANLDPGTMGVQEIVYTFDSQAQQASFGAQVLRGPYSGDYVFRYLAPVGGGVVWSPCSGSVQTLHIQTAVLARALTRSPGRVMNASVALDSMDGSVQQKFAVQWQRCR